MHSQAMWTSHVDLQWYILESRLCPQLLRSYRKVSKARFMYTLYYTYAWCQCS